MLCSQAYGERSRRLMMHGEMFSVKAQRMIIYPFVKLPLDTRHWAHHSKHQPSQMDRHIESGLHSEHTCLYSYREPCCIDPQVPGEKKTTTWYMASTVGNTIWSTSSTSKERKLCKTGSMCHWKGQYFPSLSQVFHWQSQELLCLGKRKCREK